LGARTAKFVLGLSRRGARRKLDLYIGQPVRRCSHLSPSLTTASPLLESHFYLGNRCPRRLCPLTHPPLAFSKHHKMKLQLSSLLLALSCGTAVHANFDLYSGTEGWVGFQGITSYSGKWFVFDGEPDCNMAWRVPRYNPSSDVSGDKIGVRCEGDGCSPEADPARVALVEMHFRNDPLLHWSTWWPPFTLHLWLNAELTPTVCAMMAAIYQNRGGYEMIGLDGRVYGNCDPFPGDDFRCPGEFSSISATRKFRCYSSWTAGDINHCC